MLAPEKTKYRKQQRGRRKGLAYRGSKLNFGDYGIIAMNDGWINGRQIEAARVVITRSMKREGKSWIRIFPDKPITKKPAETRMGKGKGALEYYVAVVRPGRILFEFAGVGLDLAKKIEKLVSNKLPIKTKFIAREGIEL